MTGIAISDIRIENRYRKVLGDVTTLARSMNEIGLLHPVVVTPDNLLIAGARRIRAAQLLGWTEIEATVINLTNIMRGEQEENVLRKAFTPGEAVAIANALEPIEREEARKRETKYAGRPKKGEKFTPISDGKSALDKVAAAVGMSRLTLVKAREIVEAAEQEPELFDDLVERMDKAGKVDGAYKILKSRQQKVKRQEMARAAEAIAPSERWSIKVADIETYQIDQKFDFIITDPPYPREYLRLYGILAKRAKEWLKPDGLLIVMCGQSYLDSVYRMLSEHLAYYWTACYLTQGQPTSLRQRQVNSSWKPILIYALHSNYQGKVFGDVYASKDRDKCFHEWGQSVSGMYSLISQICLPGQTIFDPFLGAGTTGVAALQHGCLFWGIDIDAEAIGISKARLGEYDAAT